MSNTTESRVLSSMEYTTEKGTITIEKIKGEENLISFFVTRGKKRAQVTENTIRQEYPWAVHMLPLVPLTKKQERVLQWVLADDNYDGNDSMIWTESFSEMLANNGVTTAKQTQGILSSLWVKGYITCAVFLGEGAKYFTLEPSAIEWLKGKQVPDSDLGDLELEDETDE